MKISDPLIDPRVLLPTDFCGSILFAPDLQGIEPDFFVAGGTLSSLYESSFNVSVFCRDQEIFRDDRISLKDTLFRYPASTKYLFENRGNAVLYDCPRDTLSILFLGWCISQREVEEFDRSFIEHVCDVGIGFGEEGKRYLTELLMKMNESNLISPKRRDAMETVISD